MSRIGRTLATMLMVALSSWSCGSTSPDATPQVASVVVSPSTSTLAVNAQLPLQAQVQDGSGAVVPGAAVVWTVQDPRIVSISAAGVVTGLAVGTSQVAANALGKSGIATITVNPPAVQSVTVSPPTLTLIVGRTANLSATVVDVAGVTVSNPSVAWSSSNPAVANVNSSTGAVTAIGVGSTTIYATSGGKNGSSIVTVTAAPITTITIGPPSSNVTAGQGVTLTATVSDANGNPVTSSTVAWTSDNAQIADPNSTGKLTANVSTSKAGTATITASIGGVKGTATITVNPGAVATVTVTGPSKNLEPGSTMPLTATALDNQGNVVPNQSFFWSSSNPIVATVTSSGLVTGLRNGSVTITAYSILVVGESGSFSINVK
jgi:uncharacterized protein YjdB